LITYTSTTVAKTEFVYDGRQRLRKRLEYSWIGSWSLTSTTLYIYDGNRVIQERNASDTPQVAYTRGSDLSGSLEGAGGIGGLLARSHGYSAGSWSTHNHYHADGNGNITYLVNSSQTAAAQYKYDPYGNQISSSGGLASANAYRFSSKEFMTTSNLYYYGYRFYHRGFQRWLNRDPIGERGGINLFGMVFNTPVNLVDAFGLSACSDFVDSLISDFQQHDNATDLGKDWVSKRNTTLPNFDDFLDDLVAGGQEGAVSRHIYGHAGAIMYGQSPLGVSPVGYFVSYWNQFWDWEQRFHRTRAESNAEIADDRAARRVADAIRKAYRQRSGDCSALEKLREKLKALLCK
jgi:RHS repeat-associated protein